MRNVPLEPPPPHGGGYLSGEVALAPTGDLIQAQGNALGKTNASNEP